MADPARILVTGASGFVAGHLLPRLIAAFPGTTITATDAATLDVTQPERVNEAIARVRPDACVHLAAVAAVPAARRDPDLAWRVNLHGSLTLAEAILRHAPDCALIYPSSADAYGRSFRVGHALDESAPLSPLNIYGATKAAAELALGAMAGDGLRLVVLRPFNHTGAGQTTEFAVAAFARQVARIEAGLQPPSLRTGALETQRDFLDVRDVCDAYVAAIARASALPSGSIFNIASGVPRRIGGIVDALLDIAGVSATIETDSVLLRPTDIASATGDSSSARAALGWAPRIAWETTLRDVLDDWRVRVLTDSGAA
jgi:GDP-4-dehydro-6-deoxy-D-mannose reductase